MKQKVIQMGYFCFGMIVGLGALSFARASIPKHGRVTDDTALYQNLSEIHVKKEQAIDFDRDITRLSAIEKYYRESLPTHAKAKRRAPAPARVKGRPAQKRASKSPHVASANPGSKKTAIR